MQQVYTLYNTGSRKKFEHAMTQIIFLFPKMETWIEYYRDGVFKYMLNKCFLPIEDQALYMDLDCTTNRNEGFHSEMYRMNIKYVSLMHFAHNMDILTHGFDIQAQHKLAGNKTGYKQASRSNGLLSVKDPVANQLRVHTSTIPTLFQQIIQIKLFLMIHKVMLLKVLSPHLLASLWFI